MKSFRSLSRRTFVKTSLSTLAVAASAPLLTTYAQAPKLMRKIPKTGEAIPAIGMGTWITFNVGNNAKARATRVEVLREFFKAGGGMIDSSPMYGSAEEVVGHVLQQLSATPGLFSATKVWTPFSAYGKVQIDNSQELWGLKKFDLFQVHNLVAWETHLERLFQMKADGNLRYVGITTSHGMRHEQMASIMETQPIDFVQFTYNIVDREAENTLLPLAKDKGIAVIINRPFQRGALTQAFENKPLPSWAADIDCQNWPQFLLKYIISHPAVTCAIPATSKPEHMRENMGALMGRMPDEKTRTRMVDYIREI